MYIPEFWCGVIATVLTLIGSIVIIAFVTHKNNGDGKNDKR